MDASAAPSSSAMSLETQVPKNVGKKSGFARSKRVTVVDHDQETIEVQDEESIVQENYFRIELPPRRNEITIFVDPETETIPTIKNATEDGHSNITWMKISFDRLPLSAADRTLRLLGKLTTLYILKTSPKSRAASYASASAAANDTIQ